MTKWCGCESVYTQTDGEKDGNVFITSTADTGGNYPTAHEQTY